MNFFKFISVLNCVIFYSIQVFEVSGMFEDIYCSSEHLQYALEKGNDLLNNFNLKSIRNNNIRNELKRIKSALKSYASASKNWSGGIARHPIYVYNLVKDLYGLRELAERLDGRIDPDDLPTQNDFIGTVRAIIRLQETYQLDVQDMADGNIAGEKSMGLTAEDCLIIAEEASVGNAYIPMFLFSTHVINKMTNVSPEDMSRAFGLRCTAEYKLGLKQLASATVKAWLNIDPTNKDAKGMEMKVKAMPSDSPTFKMDLRDLTYKVLCNGSTSQDDTQPQMPALSCRFYDNNRHPYLLLQPARQEEISLDPYTVIYRDVISDDEIKILKELATPKLEMSLVGKVTETGYTDMQKTTQRVSKGYFLPFDIPVVLKLQRRIVAITGLKWDSYEQLQVANYGVGGYYYLHHDWSENHENPLYNERIATFMFYLSDVEAGGATIFHSSRVRMVPSKGDALFWYNLHRNGTGNKATMHAACPVLLGTKWVANQWIRRNHQEFVRPCTLSSDE